MSDKKIYYLNTDTKEFSENIELTMKELKFKKSNTFPVTLCYVADSASYYRNKLDTKKSHWISILFGKSKINISNKIYLHLKFINEKFMIKTKIINVNSIDDKKINDIKILKPYGGFAGDAILISKDKNELINWMKKHNKYNSWLLQDYITNPDLVSGYKFHFRILILVRVEKGKSPQVFLARKYYYVRALNKYNTQNFYDTTVHDTHYNKDIPVFTFPEKLPDNYTNDDAQILKHKIKKIIINVFQNEHDFRPDWNAINGFEVFGADFIIHNKNPYLLEINEKMSLKGRETSAKWIVDTALNGTNNVFFKRII